MERKSELHYHMDPLCISLIQQHLDGIKSSLAGQFRDEYQTAKRDVELDEVMTKWDVEQLQGDPKRL